MAQSKGPRRNKCDNCAQRILSQTKARWEALAGTKATKSNEGLAQKTKRSGYSYSCVGPKGVGGYSMSV